MNKSPSLANVQKGYQLLGATFGGFALVVQLILMMENRVAPVGETLVRYVSFFTILTNLLVAICFTILGLKSDSLVGRFFSNARTLSAITLYIVVVGLVYNTVLRFLWEPQGMQRLVDEILHSVQPILFVVYWWKFVDKKIVQWTNVWIWLCYPLAYTVYILIRGAFSDFYPYPFIDVKALGYVQTLINGAILTGVFSGLGFALVFIGKQQKHKSE